MQSSGKQTKHSKAQKSQPVQDQPDRLTLSEEVRKLLKEKKIAASRNTEEAKAGEWEDVHKKASKRNARQRKR